MTTYTTTAETARLKRIEKTKARLGEIRARAERTMQTGSHAAHDAAADVLDLIAIVEPMNHAYPVLSHRALRSASRSPRLESVE